MKESLEKISVKACRSPGSLVHVGQVNDKPIRLFVMDYDEFGCDEWEGVAAVENNCLHWKKKSVGYIWTAFINPRRSGRLERCTEFTI